MKYRIKYVPWDKKSAFHVIGKGVIFSKVISKEHSSFRAIEALKTYRRDDAAIRAANKAKSPKRK